MSDESAVPCSYRMKLGEGGMWYYISSFARNKVRIEELVYFVGVCNCFFFVVSVSKIVSVCDFFVLVGYVQKGIVKKEREYISLNSYIHTLLLS